MRYHDCPQLTSYYKQSYHAIALMLAPLFKFLDDWKIPHLVFVNKIDQLSCDGGACGQPYRQILDALKGVSSRPIVPHQYPIGKGEQLIGFIDLVTEQAFHYHTGAPADPVPLPESLKDAEHAAREEMLEALGACGEITSQSS